ncbi:hypothetical protein AALA69_03920 [Eggerthellaceae bacterium 24-137]
MSKKRKRAVPVHTPKPMDDVVWRQSSEEATLAGKPRYNGFACGHGAHGPAKYSRARTKQAWQRHMRQEGASRGSFLFAGCGWQEMLLWLRNHGFVAICRANRALGNADATIFPGDVLG